jgi:uncharacterized membrane protein YbhN (UPF0104 family)
MGTRSGLNGRASGSRLTPLGKGLAAWIRLGTAGLLLTAIFHIIFCNEAQLHLAGLGEDWSVLDRWEQRRLAWSRGPAALWETMVGLKGPTFLFALMWCGVPIFLGALRWREAMRVQGVRLPVGEVLRISLVAHFFNAFLLGSTGGDVIKAWYASRLRENERTEAALTVVVDRLLGTLFLLLFALAWVPFAWTVPGDPGAGPVGLIPGYRRYQALVLLLSVMGGIALSASVVAFYTPWMGAGSWMDRLLSRLPRGSSLARALGSCRRFGRDRFFMGRAAIYSLGINGAIVAAFLCLARGLDLEVPDRVLWFVVPAVVCVAALPVTPSGLGVREHLFVALLAIPAFPGVKPAEALSLALLGYIANLAWSAVGGMVYALGPGSGSNVRTQG